MCIDAAHYLKRIDFQQEINIDLPTLQQLQYQHLRHIPFENLAIHANRPISLKTKDLFDKIIRNHQGGFCYELNGLFYKLLKSLGFDVKRIAGRVYQKSKNAFGKPYDHMALMVKIDGVNYLTDVGFGDFSLFPLPIHLHKSIADPAGEFQIAPYSPEYLGVFRLKNGTKSICYLFDTQARKMNAFSEMCRFHQSNPASGFTQQRLISQLTANGRITLSDKKLKISEKGETIKEEAIKASKFSHYLQKYFPMAII